MASSIPGPVVTSPAAPVYDLTKILTLSAADKNVLVMAFLHHRHGQQAIDYEAGHKAAGALGPLAFEEKLRIDLQKLKPKLKGAKAISNEIFERQLARQRIAAETEEMKQREERKPPPGIRQYFEEILDREGDR